MTSESKLAANRRNALKSTGPKSAKGKALASQNALQHGLLAKLPVLPGLESQEEWDAHMRGVVESLAPVGYMERLLAERIACVLWRMGRAIRHEREMAAIAIEEAIPSEDDEESPASLREAVRDAQSCLALTKGIAGMKAGDSVDESVAGALLEKAESACEVKLQDDDWSYEGDTWTGGELRTLLGKMATAHKAPLEDVMAEVAEAVEGELDWKRSELAKAEAKISRNVRGCLIPTPDESDTLCRYEGHLERSFYKAMHELQRLQAARSGVPVPPPAALDVTLDGGFVPQNDPGKAGKTGPIPR